jgi:hypothetical protein
MHDGRLPEGHAQNCIPVAGYARQIGEGKLATTKGERLTAGDRMRALVIEHLMCDLAFPADELNRRFGIRRADHRGSASTDRRRPGPPHRARGRRVPHYRARPAVRARDRRLLRFLARQGRGAAFLGHLAGG